MAATQKGRLLSVKSPLGADVLRALGFGGTEGISQLFSFQVEVQADVAKIVNFEDLLGKGITVTLFAPSGEKPTRFFHGICNRISQGESSGDFNQFTLDLVPSVWLLSQCTQSRIFQQMTIPDILKKVLDGFDLKFAAQTNGMEARDYCVQYRENDWNFACRLMEEEGMYYYFTFSDGAHQLVIDGPGNAPDVPAPATITYKNVSQAPAQNDNYIYRWEKTQEMTSGKVTLWDHCFEKPGENYESKANVPASVQAGQVTHKLNVANDKLEQYDYPGMFACRFDGVDPGGADRPADVGKIKPDGTRTVKLRAESEVGCAVIAKGASTCSNLTPGHKFSMETQANDSLTKALKAAGAYLVIGVSHTAKMQDQYRSGGKGDTGFEYLNRFEVVPAAATFRPPQYTYTPRVTGPQTATVVGPAGEEIFTDKYGRVKVQFHWDRQGKKDGNSSCWLRVGTPWAGRSWGMFHLPRIGQEVIVDFIEGDPDQPIVTGSVYNANQMPAYKQPDEKTKSWVKSNSTLGGEGYNEIRFEDKKGSEQIYIHGEKNLDVRIRNESMYISNNHTHVIVGGKDVTADKDDLKADYRELIYQDSHLHTKRHQEEWIEGSVKLLIGHGKSENPGNLSIVLEANRMELIGGESHLHVVKSHFVTIDEDDHLHVKGNKLTTVDGDGNYHVKGQSKILVDGIQGTKCQDFVLECTNGMGIKTANVIQAKAGTDFGVDAGNNVYIKAATSIILEGGSKISLKVGGNCVVIDSSGVSIVGSIVKINSGGSGDDGKSLSPPAPAAPTEPTDAKDAEKAKPTDPTIADSSKTGQKSCD